MKLVKFAGVGSVGFVFDVCLFTFLLLLLERVEARALAFVGAAAFTWLLNGYLTFETSQKLCWQQQVKQCGHYLACAVLSFVPNVGVFYWLNGQYEWAQQLPVLAMVPGIALGFVCNFMMANFWVFKPEQSLLPSRS